jgi:hypothetical protein
LFGYILQGIARVSTDATAAAIRCSKFMTPTDDIPDQTPSTQTERDVKPQRTARRSLGPESETRGGPEAVDEALDDSNSKP